MRRSIFTLAIVLTLIGAACGDVDSSDMSISASTTLPTTTTLTPGFIGAKLWFVNSNSLVAVTRQIPSQDNEVEQIKKVTDELLRGPTAEELATGFTTSIPAGSAILSASILDDVHRIDLSAQFASAGSQIEHALRIAQLGCTITAFGPDLVLFTVEDELPKLDTGLDLSSPVSCTMLVTAVGSIPPENVTTTLLATTTTFVLTEGPPVGTSLGVVFVEPNDVLNLRTGPGISFDIAAEVPYSATDLVATGRSADVAGSRWVELTRGGVTGWTHSGFLTELGNDFAADIRPLQSLSALVDAWQAGQGGELLVAKQGIWIVHYDPKRRISASDLMPLLTDPTLLSWGGSGCSPDECPQKTFAAAIVDPLISVYDDPDSSVTYLPVDGGNGTPAEFVIPASFRNLEYLAVHDPGDNPAYGGLDWMTWYVYFSYEDGIPHIAGLSVDFWGP